MIPRIWSRLAATAVLTFSLLTNATGGAVVYAQSAVAQQEDKTSTNAVVGGLLFLGLLKIMSGHHSKAAAPAAGQTPGTSGGQSTYIPPQPQPQPQPHPAGGITADDRLAFELLNKDRAANGLPPLTLSAELSQVAAAHSQDMIDRHYFSHNDPDGKTPFDRMRDAGISFGYAGENIAINRSVSAAEQAFMNSPGHRANILSPNFHKVGLGVRWDNNGNVYVTQEFTD